MDSRRLRVVREGSAGPGPVVCWLSRDQRLHDNWALLHAQSMAKQHHAPLVVVFCLAPDFLEAAFRQYAFMLEGLKELAAGLAEYRIGFQLLQGDPATVIPPYLAGQRAALLVTDFDPLRLKTSWLAAVASRLEIPVHQVDAHNIVPCWIASSKQEYGAYTLRPKLQRLLPGFLTDIPPLASQPVAWQDETEPVAWDKLLTKLAADRRVAPVAWPQPGERTGLNCLTNFLAERLPRYHLSQNDPASDGQSRLSPFLHFGQLSPQRVALAVSRADAPPAAVEAFLEQLIIRRELADNFCYHNPFYDRFEGFPAWARQTLDKHRSDPRPYCYSRDELAAARTHDPLWNAAQWEMVVTGTMHGYLRMYWAKKVLEWSATPEEALACAIYLNDHYQLDGRDANGYTGIAWSMGGVHDRPWGERPIFGLVRTMTAAGCARKFDLAAYYARVAALSD